jgi:hypothetical protein
MAFHDAEDPQEDDDNSLDAELRKEVENELDDKEFQKMAD